MTGNRRPLSESAAPSSPLDSAQFSGLGSQLRLPSADRLIENALVIGGGPAGLAAAIKLSQLGVRPVILELRSPNYQRPHHLNARQETLDSLDDLGVWEEICRRSSRNCEALQKSARSDCPQSTLESDSVAQLRISDTEKVLYQEVRRRGIPFIEGYRAQLFECLTGFGVRAEQMQPVGADFAPTGRVEEMGKPDLIVVADGANSPTRQQAGIDFVASSSERFYLGALVEHDLGPNYRRLGLWEGDQLRHLMATGHAHYPQTWVSVEGDAALLEMSPEERKQHLMERTSVLLNREISLAQLSWGAGLVTRVQNRSASQATAGDNLALIGDSLRTGSVWVSGGLNLALTTDIANLEELVAGLNSGEYSREQAFSIFEEKSKLATQAWHQAGEDELEGRPRSSEDGVAYACLWPQRPPT